MDPATLNMICQALEAGEAGVLVIEYSSGRTRFVPADSVGVGLLARCAHKALITRSSFQEEITGERYLFKPLGASR